MRGRVRWLRRLRRPAIVGALITVVSATTITAAAAQSGDSSKSGDLAGNLPLSIYLLIPLALALALLTAVALGASGEPEASDRRTGGVTRALGRGTTTE
jgi:hypothetical protein